MYFLLRVLSFLAVRIYYRSRLVLGKKHLHFKGPAIVVCNHPSTLLDVLNIGIEVRQNMYFLANYGLFRHPVASWLLRRLYCIPVMRREDLLPGEKQDNDTAFERSYQHLEKGGVLFIAAEGTSWMNRFIRPFRGGAARIACGAESRNNWELDVKIVPIGMSYSAADRFRSSMVMQAGPALYVRDYRGQWEENSTATAGVITSELERRVRSLAIDARDEAGEILIGRLETIMRTDEKLDARADFERSRQLALQFAQDEALQKQAGDYFHELNRYGLADRGLKQQSAGGNSGFFIARFIGLLLFFPWFAAGILFWALPLGIPAWINRKLGIYVGYSSAVHTVIGMFTVPAALVFAYKMADHWSGVVLVIMSAMVVEFYLLAWREARMRWKAWRWVRHNRDKAGPLLKMREEILGYIQEQIGLLKTP